MLAAVLVVVFPTGCSSNPLPADKAAYAGHWKGDGVDLVISSDGRCSYHKTAGSENVEINAPIRSFDGDDFVVGVPMINTTFDVTAPPHEDGGTWKMTVDGHELVRE